MFDGKIGSRVVNFGGTRKEADKKTSKALLDESRKQRELRAIQKTKNEAACRIQAKIRMRLTRKKSVVAFRALFDKKVTDISKLKSVFAVKNAVFNVPLTIIDSLLHSFLFFYEYSVDNDRLVVLVDLLFDSINCENGPFNYLVDASQSSNWQVSFYRFENTKLMRLKKFCALCLQSFITVNSTASVNRFVKSVCLVDENGSPLYFVKVAMCCLLCEETCKTIQWIVTHNGVSNEGTSIGLKIIEQCIKDNDDLSSHSSSIITVITTLKEVSIVTII